MAQTVEPIDIYLHAAIIALYPEFDMLIRRGVKEDAAMDQIVKLAWQLARKIQDKKSVWT